jgi:hypothetical protein
MSQRKFNKAAVHDNGDVVETKAAALQQYEDDDGHFSLVRYLLFPSSFPMSFHIYILIGTFDWPILSLL